jgi:hypothetical protein
VDNCPPPDGLVRSIQGEEGPFAVRLAPGRPQTADYVFEIDGCYYLVDQKITATARSITVERTEAGFWLEARIEPRQECLVK